MEKKNSFILREGVQGVENKLQIELICSTQMELGGREMSPWEIGS